MGGGLGFLVAVAALGLATTVPAVAGKSVHRDAGNPTGIFNADFSPKKLSKTKPTPIRFTATVKFKERPPPMKELLLRFDRRVNLDIEKIPTTKEVPGCLSGSGPRQTVGQVRKACGPAVVGYGRMDVDVQFPDQPPVQVASQMVALNGSVEGGKATLYLYSFFSAPLTGSIVTTVQLEKIRKGRYGMEAISTIPKIAGGSGSVTSFALSLKRGILSATCPSGRLGFQGKAVSSDGTRRGGPVVRTCTPKPEARR